MLLLSGNQSYILVGATIRRHCLSMDEAAPFWRTNLHVLAFDHGCQANRQAFQSPPRRFVRRNLKRARRSLGPGPLRPALLDAMNTGHDGTLTAWVTDISAQRG